MIFKFQHQIRDQPQSIISVGYKHHQPKVCCIYVIEPVFECFFHRQPNRLSLLVAGGGANGETIKVRFHRIIWCTNCLAIGFGSWFTWIYHFIHSIPFPIHIWFDCQCDERYDSQQETTSTTEIEDRSPDRKRFVDQSLEILKQKKTAKTIKYRDSEQEWS